MKIKFCLIVLAVVSGLLLTALSVLLKATEPVHATPAACVPGPHSGTITTNQTWCLVDSPHLMSADVTVAQGVILTIEPGVTVKAGTVNVALTVQGQLDAVGTGEAQIVFTSLADSGPGEWRGITFDGGTGTLRHAVVRYAGRRTYICGAGVNSAAINVRNVQAGMVTIQDSEVRDSSYYNNSDHGLCVKDSRVAVIDTTFSGIGDNAGAMDYPVYISGPTSDVSLSGLRLENNIYNRVILDLGAMTGHDFTLSAQPVMDGYELYRGTAGSHFIVPAGTTMTVEPGVTVFNNWDINQTLVVQGHLQAVGTEEAPVVFTSRQDSGPYQWKGITFEGGTGLLRHAIVRYAGRGSYGGPGGGSGITAANVQTGEVRIENSQVRDISGGSLTANYGLTLLNSRAVVSDTLFTAISDAVGPNPAAIWVKDNSTLTLSGSAVQDNVRNGLLVEGAAQVQIADTAIVQNGGHGVLVSGNTAVLTMTGSIVLASSQDGVRNSGNAQVTLGGADGLGNTLLGNGGYGANQVGTGAQMVATHNWWGDVSGPYHATNPDGQGENVSDRVLFDPWAVDWQGQMPDGVYVSLTGPRRVVPGGAAPYVLMYVNGRDETVEDAVLVLVLPAPTLFQEATHGGGYLAQQHAVVWKLGDLEPGASGTVAAQTAYAWGVPIGSEYGAQALMAGRNLPLSLANPEWYLDSTPLELLGSTPLSDAELAAERAAYPDLDLIYTEAEADGFLAGGAVRLTLDVGDPITQVVMLRRAGKEVLYLRRQGGRVMASTFGATWYAVREAEGGLVHDLQAGAETYWGTWGSDETPSETGLAFSNCRYPNVPAMLLDDKIGRLAQVFGSGTCYPCLAGGSCVKCFAALQGVVPLPEATGILACAAEAGIGGGAGPDWWLIPPTTPYCPSDARYILCEKPWWSKRYRYYDYPCVQGLVIWSQLGGLRRWGPHWCDKWETCFSGVTGTSAKLRCQCVPVYTPPKPLGDARGLALGFRPFTAVEAAPPPEAGSRLFGCDGSQQGVSKCPLTKIRTPHDPNAKYGPEGDLLAGQTVTYTVTYENEGDGRAYGVFVVDQLDPALDLSTLIIYGPGELIAENRTILWTVGELGPKGDPDSTGVVSFTVALRDDLLPGTAVINQATVFFPTVGEETPTNPVVNVVQTLAAVPQRLETTYMQPVAVTLSGRGPAGVPLAFEVVAGPLNGELSGTAPDLVYTPAENATGLDEFTFKVTGGGQESRPATVQLVIDPAGDTTPPQVRWAFPADGAVDVAITAGAIFTDDVGPVYGPMPWVQFSEAMDEETITDDVVQMVGGVGQVVPVSVGYDGATRRAMVYPRQALQGGVTYTLTVAAGVKDLAGNGMGAPHTWSFTTRQETRRIYLPLVVRNQ